MVKDMQEIEKTLWAAADKMIGGLSVSNYKFVVLGLIFLKYISDSFEEKYNDYWKGHTSNYLMVKVKSDKDLTNKTSMVKITNIDGHELQGKLV